MTENARDIPFLMSLRIVAEVTKLLTSPAELVLALADNSEAFDALTRAVNLLGPTVPSLTLQDLYKAIVSLDKRIDMIIGKGTR